MRPRSRHLCTQLHAVTGWLCVALQLVAFAAAGWHHHRRAADQPALLTAHCSGDDHRHDCASHRHADSRGDDRRPAHTPCDHQDSQGCTICSAILGLHHATPGERIELIAFLRHVKAEMCESARPFVTRVPGRQHARAPPDHA